MKLKQLLEKKLSIDKMFLANIDVDDTFLAQIPTNEIIENKELIAQIFQDETCTTHHYKILALMYDYLITINDMTFCTLGTRDLQRYFSITRAQADKSVKRLLDTGYLTKISTGKYNLTDKAFSLLNQTFGV